MKDSTTRWIGRTLCTVFSILAIVVYMPSERMEQDQMLGCLVAWALISSWASALFWHASRPYFPLREKLPALRIPCRISVVALVIAVIQVPLWGVMTGQFPPYNFSGIQVAVVIIGVLFGMVGPGAPGILVFTRSMEAANKERLRRIRDDKRK